MTEKEAARELELLKVDLPTFQPAQPAHKMGSGEAAQTSSSSQGSDAAEGMLWLMGLGIVGLFLFFGIMSGFQWLFDVNLREKIFKQPLWAVSYVFLVAISIFSGFEIRALIRQQKSKELRRAFALVVLLAGMLSYLLFYAHHTWSITIPASPYIAGLAALIGLGVGWVLPGLVDTEPYGSLTYLILLIILVAFTWLARIESNVVYGWASFSLIFTYFLRLAVNGVRRSVARSKRSDA